MPTIGPIPSPPLHPCPSGVSSECPPFAGSRRGPPCVENSRPSPPPLAQSIRETPQACTARADGLAPVQHIHSRQAQRRNRTEQHQRHAMSHQVQNHEPPASSPDIADHLDKLLSVQVVHQAHAHGHIGLRQNLPHGVQLENRELPHATLWRPQSHNQHIRPHLPPHFLQQPSVPT